MCLCRNVKKHICCINAELYIYELEQWLQQMASTLGQVLQTSRGEPQAHAAPHPGIPVSNTVASINPEAFPQCVPLILPVKHDGSPDKRKELLTQGTILLYV